MKTIKRIFLALILIALIALGIALVIPKSQYVLLGWLKKESFEEGMPQSYWVERLKDPDSKIRAEAAGALSRIGPDAAAAVPDLAKALKDDEALEVKIDAAHALDKMGPAAKTAVPELIAALSGPNLLLRMKAATALTTLGPDAKDAVPALIQAVQERSNLMSVVPWAINISGQAAGALGRIGMPAAKPAIPILRKALKGDDAKLAEAAALALGRLEAREAIPDLVEALNGKSDMLKIQAAVALANFGPDARAAVPALIVALNDKKSLERFNIIAVTTLEAIGPEAKAAVPDLIKALDEPDSGIARAAARALGSIGPDAKSAVPRLVQKLDDDDPYVRRDAAASLKKIDPEAAAKAQSM